MQQLLGSCTKAAFLFVCVQVLGVQLAKMTPSRGYCAELATGVVISVASVYGLPVSTTQIIVSSVWPACVYHTNHCEYSLMGLLFVVGEI